MLLLVGLTASTEVFLDWMEGDGCHGDADPGIVSIGGQGGGSSGSGSSSWGMAEDGGGGGASLGGPSVDGEDRKCSVSLLLEARQRCIVHVCT